MAEGKLLLIGTPIGNLGDLAPRAVEALRSCEMILCEDTRHSGRLLSHLGIDARLESFHDYNEDAKAAGVIERIAAGAVVGLISDAGMPVLSDPGYPLVRLARDRAIRVEPVPGPFAGALALAASGLPPLPFAFFGFAPHREGERQDFYRSIAALGMTAVVYESPERIVSSLHDAAIAFGDGEVTVAREMTKLHEEILNGTIGEVAETLGSRESIRGEITIVLAARREAEKRPADPAVIAGEFRRLRESGMRRTDATKILAERYGLKKSELYRMLVEE